MDRAAARGGTAPGGHIGSAWGACAALDDRAPRRSVEQRSRLDRAPDEQGALRVDLARAERVVTDLAVAHVVVARQADRLNVGAQLAARARHPQPIARR